MSANLIIRIDDLGRHHNEKNPDPDLSFFAPIHELLKERDLPYAPCIIASRLNKEGIAWARENFYQSITPCLHGFDHKPTIKPDDEFGGCSYQGILEKLLRGIKALIPLRVYGMSPPWNRYDDRVIRACRAAGLRYFLAGYGREKPEFYRDQEGVLVIPARNDLYLRGGSTKRAIETIKQMRTPNMDFIGLQVLTIHPAWEITSLGNGELERLLDELTTIPVVDLKTWEPQAESLQ